MNLIKWKTSQVIGAVAGGMLMLSPALADRGGILRMLPVATGAGLLFTLPSATHSREEDDSVWAYLKSGWQILTKETVTETRQILAEVGPPSLTRWADSVAATFTDPLELFKRLHEKSFLLVAETGGGKTWLMHQSVLYATDTKDQFHILDKSYGKRGLTWWNLPVGKQVFLFGPDDAENLPDVVHSIYQERNRRKKLIEDAAQQGRNIPEFPRQRLYITEWNQTQASYIAFQKQSVTPDVPDSGLPTMDQIQFWINEILFDGHGYNLFLGLDVQSAAVGRINIDQSQQSQVNWLILGASALKDSELGKFGLKPTVWKPQVMAARSLPGMSRCGIAILDGVPHLYNPVPYGEGLIIPEAQQQLSEVEQWLELRKPELIEYLDSCENPSPSGIFDQRFKMDFPKGYVNRRGDNPYYAAFKDFVINYQSGK
jgi:hypothetical protein